MRRAIVAIGALLAVGCGAPDPSALFPFGRTMTFSPEPGAEGEASIEAETRAMIQRWNTATDAVMKTGAGGVPVRFVDQAYDADGVAVCGATERVIDADTKVTLGIVSIEITRVKSDGCMHPADVLVHEGAHAFAPGAPHARSGVYRAGADDPEINADTLESVCTVFDCKAFVAEVAP
jgi:hypothetical protein